MNTLPKVVPESEYGVEVTIHPSIQHRCPHKDELDEGWITITWRCEGASIELHSLAAWLDRFKDVEISHEGLVGLVTRELALLDPRVVLVEAPRAGFVTAGIPVEVVGALPGDSLGPEGA